MEELYRMIEDKIYAAGYEGQVSGEEIYDEICDEIEDKEEGSYIFMSKKEDDTIYEREHQYVEHVFCDAERNDARTQIVGRILLEKQLQEIRLYDSYHE